MKRIIWLFALLSLVLVSTAFAAPKKPLPNLAALSAETKSATIEMPKLILAMDTAVSSFQRYQKEANLYLGIYKEKHVALERASADRERYRVTYYADLNANIESHVSRCKGELPEPEYSNCVSEEAALNVRIKQTNTAWQDYVAQWNKQNVEPVNALLDKYNVRLAELEALSNQQHDIYVKALARTKAVHARVLAISDYFNKMCTAEVWPYSEEERLKYCTNINWDGVGQGLPALHLYTGPWSVMPQ